MFCSARAAPIFAIPGYQACNKRNPGSGCAAIGGVDRRLAVLGTSDKCIANYPGDFAQALVVLDATVDLSGPSGVRVVRFEDLHTLPGDTPHIETILKPGRDHNRFHNSRWAMDAALALFEDSRSRFIRFCVGIGGSGAGHGWRNNKAGTYCAGRRCFEAVARARS